MAYEYAVASRYLIAGRWQSVMLVGGVTIAVIAFVFITALVMGLRGFITQQTLGELAHVTLEPPDRVARAIPPASGETMLTAVEPFSAQRRQIREWRAAVDAAEADPRVAVISPQVVGSGFVVRGQGIRPASIQGVEPDKLSAISDIAGKLTDGEASLDINGIVVGDGLAKNLGLRVGQPVIVRSERGVTQRLIVRGIFFLGVGNLDESLAYVNIRAARALFDLPQGVSRIEIKLNDLFEADDVAERLGAATGLKSEPWSKKYGQILAALEGQGRSGNMIQGFALAIAVFSVASSLYLTTYRRKAEIGIMRAMGASKGFIARVFIAQGAAIGLIGSVVGAFLGWRLVTWLGEGLRQPNGAPLFPVDPAQGGYAAVILLTTIGGVLAAILPARAAMRIDPVEAIQQ
jgi:lipoprotein-releasing system permease protein